METSLGEGETEFKPAVICFKIDLVHGGVVGH